MVSLKHLFQSQKADGTNVTLVKPSNWNDEHKFETAADNILLGRPAGAGPGPVQEIPFLSVFPPGMMMPYAGINTPEGWLRCEGQLLVRSEYAGLYGVVGTTFNTGGETGSQFRLPDLRGRVIAGVDAAGVRLTSTWYAGGNPALLGAGGGLQAEQALIPQAHVTLNSLSVAGSVTGVSVSGSVSGTFSGTASAGGGSGAGSNFVAGDITLTSSGTFSNGTGTWTQGASSGGGTIDVNNYTAHQTNIPPSLTLYYLIKI